MGEQPKAKEWVGLVAHMANTVVEAQQRLDEAFAEEVRRATVDAAAFEKHVGRELASLLIPSRIDLHSTNIETGCTFAEARSVEGGISLNLFGRPITQFLSGRYEERHEEGARLSLTVDVLRQVKPNPNRSDQGSQQ